ncbi:MAG: hypothetical protein KJO60_02825 [Desulfofustis sp.]|nr:hypothetical protein [Desulfofustis sp.]
MIKLFPYIVAVSAAPFLWVEPLLAAEADWQWSGHLRGSGLLEYYDDGNFLALTRGEQLFLNGSVDGRLNMALYLGEFTNLNIDYEVVGRGGQTRETINEAAEQIPGVLDSTLYQATLPSDDDQLFSLTKIVSEGDDYIVYHRLDRLFLGHESGLGNLSIGRQALTWGNGLLFNPADLINPFAPSDIIRDYKIGSDMVLYQNGFDFITDLQLVVVPRTDEEDDLDYDQSTYGLKTRITGEYGDLDIYVMKNYEDPVLGGGFSTYLRNGVLRSDITWTYLDEDSETKSFFSGVLNYDRSWTWSGRNWYGFMEFYYNGLGQSDPLDALQSRALTDRFRRGEIFVTGKYYIDALLQYEAHPLVNLLVTTIYNLEDNSFLFQPRLNWEVSQSFELLLGINVSEGSAGSEFGELINPQDGIGFGNPSQAYLIATYFF